MHSLLNKICLLFLKIDLEIIGSQSNDLGTICYTAMNYLVLFGDYPYIQSSNKNKCNQRFNNIVTGHMLCSLNQLVFFDADPKK